MNSCEVIDYYKNHNNLATRKKFGITYKQLKLICEELNFKKTADQIRNTYKETKQTKYGSLEKAYEVMVKHKNDTILNLYGSKDLYYEIRDNNARKTNRRTIGVDYPMQSPEIVKKSNETKRRNK